MSCRPQVHDVGASTVRRGAIAETEATVEEFMLRCPKTLPAHVSIAEARAALGNDHVHMVLLTEDAMLVGTLTRSDLPTAEAVGPARSWSTLAGRTVRLDASMTVVQRLLATQGIRRLAVVDADGSLLGLACLKRHRSGFCSDADVAGRSRDPVTSQSVHTAVHSH